MQGITLIQGKFTSDGTAQNIQITSDVDWMTVYNFTQAATQQATGRGVEFYWQRGMSSDTGIEYKKTNATDALNMVTLASGGFTLLDTASQVPGAEIVGTTITKAAPPVCTVGSTASLVTGDIVRMYASDEMDQLNGLLFTIDVINGTTFHLTNISTNTANFTASTAFAIRRIPNLPQFVPSSRYISNISAAASAIITMTVDHAYTVGQQVRIICPSAFGMTEINTLQAEITAIGDADADGFTNTITVAIDSSAFTAFAWPAASAAPLTWAQVVPIGEDATGGVANSLDDATNNTSFIGMRLAAGVQSPAGSTDDVIYYVAGKSLVVNN